MADFSVHSWDRPSSVYRPTCVTHPFCEIYPSELQLNKANSSDTEAPFLDLHLTISNGFVSAIIYDFDFDILTFPFLDGDIPRAPSYWVYILNTKRNATLNRIPKQHLGIFSQFYTTWKSKEFLIMIWLILIWSSNSRQKAEDHNAVPHTKSEDNSRSPSKVCICYQVKEILVKCISFL